MFVYLHKYICVEMLDCLACSDEELWYGCVTVCIVCLCCSWDPLENEMDHLKGLSLNKRIELN